MIVITGVAAERGIAGAGLQRLNPTRRNRWRSRLLPSLDKGLGELRYGRERVAVSLWREWPRRGGIRSKVTYAAMRRVLSGVKRGALVAKGTPSPAGHALNLTAAREVDEPREEGRVAETRGSRLGDRHRTKAVRTLILA